MWASGKSSNEQKQQTGSVKESEGIRIITDHNRDGIIVKHLLDGGTGERSMMDH